MRIAYRNVIDDDSTIILTPSSELAGYPVENVQEQRLSTKWKTDTTTAQSVLIDLVSPTTAISSINTIAILGHNIVSGATVTVQANATDSWGSPSFTTTMTIIESGAILKFLATSQLYRYWRFAFAGQASLEIGRLWLGEYLTIDPSALIGFEVGKNRSDNVFHGRGRQKFASIGNSWRSFLLNFPPMTETMISAISTFYDYVGRHSSFIFCNFDTDRNYTLVEPCYVSINEDINFINNKYMRFDWSLSLEEEL